MAHDVFISYSNYDRTTAYAVSALLEQNKIRCWIAPRDILPGEEYAEAIIRGIRNSNIFILIFSSKSNHSAHVKKEVERAVSQSIPIITFKIENDTLSDSMEYYISSAHWLDALTPPLERNIKELSKSVLDLIGKDQNHEPINSLNVKNEEDFNLIEYPEIVKDNEIMELIKPKQEKLEQYKEFYVEIKRIMDESSGNKHDTAMNLSLKSSELHKKGKYFEAEAYLRGCLNLLLDEGINEILMPQGLHKLAFILEKQGELNEAESLHRTAMKIRVWRLGSKHISTATSFHNLAKVLQKIDKTEAELYYQKALIIREKEYGPDDPNTIIIREDISNLRSD